MKEILNKIKGDFFSIMAPGSHLLATLIIFVGSVSDKYKEYLKFDLITEQSVKLNDYWPLYILAIFLAYLLGNFLHVIPVGNADEICKKLFSWMAGKNVLVAKYYSDNFPYHSTLTKFLEYLQANGFPKDLFSVPSEDSLYTEFKFFKTVLCAELPAVFEYTQALENRVRLFAGMFWSSCTGIVACVALGILSLFPTTGISWSTCHTLLLITSIVVGFLLGVQLPRARGQEVEYVYLGYLSYLVKSRRDDTEKRNQKTPILPLTLPFCCVQSCRLSRY